MMIKTPGSATGTALRAALVMGGLALAAPAQAQAPSTPLALNSAGGSSTLTAARSVSSALERGRYAVVIDLDENMLHFKQGEVTLWSAPVGTGTGLRLETEENKWDFSTPEGVFHVQYKEENPTWVAPDWYFVRNNLPIPPRNDRRRYFPGGLGSAAVYIGRDLAIHGTDKPELLGQRVSHGCIRLSNADALRLYHNVQVGTEVVIVGGERARQETRAVAEGRVAAPSTFTPDRPAPRDAVLERWRRASTERLLDVLEEELWKPAEESRWSEVAGLLLRRGVENDADALRGVLLRAGDLPNDVIEREYRTFVADAFVRRPARTLTILSGLSLRERDLVARAIVAGTMGLYSGDLDAHSAPWPTRRIPRDLVEPEARRGWQAVERAERQYRATGELRQA
jgi:lipoprotein-anchoring transpeptidase ErfK/SrfK